jgi:hypothetical protein
MDLAYRTNGFLNGAVNSDSFFTRFVLYDEDRCTEEIRSDASPILPSTGKEFATGLPSLQRPRFDLLSPHE